MRGGDVAAAEAGSPRSPDLYDLSDDSDYAAAAAASDHTAMRTDPADRGSEETARVDVVYEKERVTIHPSQYGSGRISGKLRLFLQQGSLFLSWEPNEGADSLSTSSVGVEIEKYRNLYTIKALPLSDVRFIRRHTPTFGLDYIIIVLSSGLAFPPFYFYNGGIRELFATLKQHVFIIRSDDDPNVFLVNDFQDPLQKSLSSLELPGVASVANAMSRQNSLSFTGSNDESRCNTSGVRALTEDEQLYLRLSRLGVPEGVTLLEFEQVILEEVQDQPEEPAEPVDGGDAAEVLPECPDHRPSTFLKDDMLYQGFCKTCLHPAGDED